MIARLFTRELQLKLLLLAGFGLVFWPVVLWYIRRTLDGSDEPWGLLALAAAAALLLWDKAAPPVQHRGRLAAAGALLCLYIACYGWMPPLVRAILAVLTLCTLMVRAPGGIGATGLLLLSLPIVATSQFYAGYPLRLFTAGASSVLLNGIGIPVEQTGTLLTWRGEQVLVDAPCSGVQMIWSGMFLAFALAAFLRLHARQSVALLAIAVSAIIGANLVRSTLLFVKESGMVDLPAWTHEGIGVAAFVAAALLIARFAGKGEAHAH